jgi:hypothetical protein
LKLRSSDIRRAKSSRYNNKKLADYTTPDQVFDRYIPYFERELGMNLVIKSSSRMRLSKMTTTYYREIRLGSGWNDYAPDVRAAILVHEAVHARQWRGYGASRFGLYYASNPRWRWSIEMQGYRESVRWAVIAMNAAQLPAAAIEGRIDEYIGDCTQSLVTAYSLGRISKSNLRRHTQEILLETAAAQMQDLAA